jgi:uncharacterized RDD family membrane protein YckC
MPERGPGSLARVGRRMVAVAVDWSLCILIASGLMSYRLGEGGVGPFKPLVVFVLMNIVLVGTLGSTIGQRLLGFRVARVGGGHAGPCLASVRTILLAVVIPAVIWDRDTRGFHDRIAGTVTVRI